MSSCPRLVSLTPLSSPLLRIQTFQKLELFITTSISNRYRRYEEKMSKERDLTYIYTKTTPTPRSKQRFQDTSWRCESMELNTKPLIKPFQVVRRTAKVTAWPSHVEEDELRFFTAARVRDGLLLNGPENLSSLKPISKTNHLSPSITRRLNETQNFSYMDTCHRLLFRIS